METEDIRQLEKDTQKPAHESISRFGVCVEEWGILGSGLDRACSGPLQCRHAHALSSPELPQDLDTELLLTPVRLGT